MPDVDALTAKARAAGTDEERQAAYEELQLKLNEVGPFIPLMQTAINLAGSSELTGIVYNAVWTIDFADIGHAA